VLRTAPEVAEISNRFQAARQKFHDFGWVLSAIGGQNLPFHWDGLIMGSDTGAEAAAWRVAISRLETDASAELPSE
jgi:hypothetical protein